MTHVLPAAWTGRNDLEEGPDASRWHQSIRSWSQAQSGCTALIGFACDIGVRRNHGRAGAAAGPAALRAALANVPVHGGLRLRDAGDIADAKADGSDDNLESLQDEYASLVAQIVRGESLAIGLGGGHEIAWGSWCGLLAGLGSGAAGRRVGIVNFDAHFDLRAGERATSGTPFRQIAEQCQRTGRPFDYCCIGVSRYANTQPLFARAQNLGVTYLLDEELLVTDLAAAHRRVADFLAPLDALYLTFCLDVLPAGVAPGVSAPAARGVGLEVLEPLLDRVLGSGRVRIADIAELNPRFDLDQRTARVAARLVARIADAVGRRASVP